METAGSTRSDTGFVLLIFSISLANFMAALDGTIVSVALPTISQIFTVAPGMASWIITGYILVMSGCVLIFGKVSDIIGFKKVFLYGFLIFTLGSLASGYLPGFLNSFPVFILSRIFQAVGAAMIMAIGPAMVTAFIPMELKGKAMGTIFTIQALGGAIGPTLGGFLTQHLSWSWIFFINIPIGIGAILLGSRVIPESTAKPWRPGFDRTGAVLIFFGLASLLFFLSEGEVFGWTSQIILGSFTLSLLMLGGFFWHELSAPDPLLEVRLFLNRNFLVTNLTIILLFFNFAGIFYLFPFYLQYVQGHSPSVVGLLFSTFSASIMLGGIIGGMVYNTQNGRRINIAAALLEVSGYFLITLVRADTSPWFVVICLFLIGTGVGMILTSASSMVMNSVSKKNQGMISSFTNLERFIPMIMGIAIFNIILIKGMAEIGITGELSKSVLAGVRAEALSGCFETAYLFAFLVSIFILISALLARQETHPDYRTDSK